MNIKKAVVGIVPIALAGTCYGGGEFLNTSLIKDGWCFTPVVENNEVNRIFAVRTEDTIGLYAVAGMMIEVDINGEFDSFAWSNATYEEMLVSVAHEWTIDYDNIADNFPLDISYSEFQIEIDNAAAGAPILAAPFTLGLFENDPLQVFVQAVSDPEPILSPLEDSGHSAVSTVGGSKVGPPSPADDGCIHLMTDLVNGVIVAAEDYVQNEANFMDRFQLELAQGTTGDCGCSEVLSVETEPWRTFCGDWSMGDLQSRPLCEARREWTRTVFTIRDRTYTLVCSDCIAQQCTQSRTRTKTQTAYGPSFPINVWACDIDLVPGSEGGQPVGAPCNPVTWFDLAFGGADATNWQPASCPSSLSCP